MLFEKTPSAAETYTLTVDTHGPAADFAHFVVSDGYDVMVKKGYGRLSADLPRGVYRVVMELNENVAEKIIRLDRHVTEYFEPPKGYSSIVAADYASSHEYYSSEAIRWSRTPTVAEAAPGTGGSLFLFFRYPSKEVRQESKTGNLGKGFLVLNAKRQKLYSLTDRRAVKGNARTGWLAFQVPLPAGVYYLHYQREPKREIPLYVFHEWQTQVFLTFRDGPVFASLKISIEGPKTAFDNTNQNNYVVDAILQKLHNGIYFVPEKILRRLAYDKWENPILGMLAAYVYLLSDRRDQDGLFRQVIDNLVNFILRDAGSPDLTVLRMVEAMRAKKSPAQLLLREPCMFLAGMRAAIAASTQHPGIIVPESAAEKVVPRLYADLVWTSYEPLPLPSSRQQKIAKVLRSGVRGLITKGVPTDDDDAGEEYTDILSDLPEKMPRRAGEVVETNGWVAVSLLDRVARLRTDQKLDVAELASQLQVTPNIVLKTIHQLLQFQNRSSVKKPFDADSIAGFETEAAFKEAHSKLEKLFKEIL